MKSYRIYKYYKSSQNLFLFDSTLKQIVEQLKKTFPKLTIRWNKIAGVSLLEVYCSYSQEVFNGLTSSRDRSLLYMRLDFRAGMRKERRDCRQQIKKQNMRCPHNAKFPLVKIDTPVNQI